MYSSLFYSAIIVFYNLTIVVYTSVKSLHFTITVISVFLLLIVDLHPTFRIKSTRYHFFIVHKSYATLPSLPNILYGYPFTSNHDPHSKASDSMRGLFNFNSLPTEEQELLKTRTMVLRTGKAVQPHPPTRRTLSAVCSKLIL